ncbi:MAG: PD40 domain-containing protein, partial [Candidatus Cloacimonetes bacterium]|nr:PD40 domain-containing protein [Candidatus Cloacimonadota bacterium]
FVSKTSFGDKIYVMNFKTGEIVYTFSFPQFDAIYEIDVSKDGKKITFAGQKDLKNDIYVYEIETGKITQITNDHYYDNQPRWSPDDKKIVFTSARTLNEDIKRDQVFSKLTGDIFYYDLEENVFYNVTDDKQNNSFSFWNSDGSKILFVSEKEITTNFEVIDILTGQRAQVTNVHGGVFAGDISANDDELIFSGYYHGGWDIYLRSNPLDDLEYADYKIPERFEFKDDFYEKFDISRYKVFGKTDRKFKKELPEYSPSVTKIGIGNFTKIDSMNQRYNIELDKKPTEIHEPLIKPYKTRFALDYLWGGVAYSPSGGTYAQLQFGLSDLMGNHSLGINLGISGDLDTSDLILNYLYLAHRIDYGVGCFYLNDEWVYKVIYADESPCDYFREREREFGIYTILRYPFNKFWRVDFDNLFYKNIVKRDWRDDINGKWLEEYLPQYMQDPPNNLSIKETELVCAPQITFVHDNAIYGSVGPVSGWRGALLFNRSFSTKKSYSVVFSDIRKYLFFEKRYSLAFRLLEGAIIGDTNQRFVMDFFSGVRGYNKEIEGKKKFLSSIELRFPFIDNLKLSFPLPLYFYQLRGSAFIDLGSVWTDNKDLRFYENDRLKDLKLGIGFGPRLNMGYFVLKFDIAWHTDLYDFSKPSYYFSLAPDF